ncbi:hypothetical protein L228DRAFT_244060 [Xylona heveae TC161]|uniref:Uncharacterized protein n=1 Tax=Xylona heveae (strain CBS 132557 / TC161) TaxID=1328760 RepID=A0A165IR65_XYLHT|nr:hypothetical protein L228DRAFT_244060 [Xylona heveae TC161]KZF25265.1 hypothetical protein L228DRAFT_244060 [Xylona heveae TC161]
MSSEDRQPLLRRPLSREWRPSNPFANFSVRAPSILSRNSSSNAVDKGKEKEKDKDKDKDKYKLRMPTPPADPTPATKREQEGLMNSHHSQLKFLAQRIKLINEFMDMDTVMFERLRKENDRSRDAKYMEERVLLLHMCKDTFVKMVKWHRLEAARLGAMIASEGEHYVPPSDLPSPFEWTELLKN